MNIGILGAGTFGIALAKLLDSKGYSVIVYSHRLSAVNELNNTHIHPKFKDIVLNNTISFSNDLSSVVKDKDVIIFALPSTTIRDYARKIKDLISDNQIIVDVSKGIEESSLKTLSEVIKEEIINAKVVTLSGPTHAEELIKDLPTTIVSASDDLALAKYVQTIFNTNCLRVYTNNDQIGIEICGALKNIMAIASGISDGLGYGDNAKAALITRGLQEIKRLGSKMGCKEETFFGLAGVGDLIVTCTSNNSRNHNFGYLIGQGKTKQEAQEEIGMVVEGLNTLPAALKLKDKYKVEMPIVSGVNEIINNQVDPKLAVDALFKRDLKSE